MKTFGKTLASLLLVFTAITSGFFGACKSGKEEQGAAFTAYLGDYFTLPTDGVVTDSDGKEVTTEGGAFRVTDEDGYTLKVGDKAYKIEVVKNKPLTITTEFTEKYFVYESGKAKFPGVEVNGAIGAVTKQYRLYKGERLYYHTNNEFVPNGTGDYELKITCTDAMGNSASETVVYHVIEESDDKANAIAVFDSPTGKSHFANLFGFMEPRYTEEVAYTGERGSTALRISGESYFSQSFQLTELYDADITDDLGFYFRIYNDGTQAITVYINWTYSFELLPKQWNEIYLENIDDSQWSSNDIFADYVTNENINGLYFETLYDKQGSDTATLYFSNIYKVPLYEADVFNRLIENAEITDDTVAHYKSLVRTYHLFSSLEKKRIDGFAEKVEEKLWKYYEEKYQTTYTANKLIDFNSGLWREQAKLGGGIAVHDAAAESAPNAQTGDTGVTTITTLKASYTVSLSLEMPTVSQYSSAEQNADLAYLYNGFSFDLYCPVLTGYTVYCSVNGAYTSLEQGEWNEIFYDLGNAKLRGNEIQIYLAKKTAWDSAFPQGTQFKISSIYGKPTPFADTLNGYLKQLAEMTDEQILSSAISQKAFDAYRELDYAQRNGVVGYNDFVKRYSLALLPQTERIDGVGYAFNTEKGLKQISAKDCILSYSTERRYGLNNGSLLVVPDSKKDPWSAYVQLDAPTMVEYSPAYCYVWVEGSADSYQCSLHHPLDNSMYKTRTVLQKGAWTKLYIPTTTAGLLGCSLHFATTDWQRRIPDDTKFYVSPIYFENYVSDSEVPGSENELPFVKF
ncbi:MAG: hypothetical protein IJ514_00225 [Clostridia bacterium]|nr:hypothetical protein [Clostridia bacterium]